MPLSFRRHTDSDEFLAAAGPFLAAREAEHNLIFGICSWLRLNPDVDGSAHFASVSDGDRTVLVAIRTAPHNLVLSTVDDLGAVDVLADNLRDDDLPGVLGPTEAAARFASAWATARGASSRLLDSERIFRLSRVVPPARPAAGSWRHLEPSDHAIVARWIIAFQAEALPEEPPIEDPGMVADRWIAQAGRIGYVWEADGAVVSFAGASGETPNGIRIGPVYTPPEHRNRGYATSLTAAVSQDQLDRGRRFTFLFTDLANPTSNRIYRAIGYEPVVDMAKHVFTTPHA